MAFLSHNSSDMPELAPVMNVLFKGGATFQYAYLAGICKGPFEIGSKEVPWSVWGSYQTIWSPPLPNVTWLSGLRPYTATPPLIRHYTNFLPCYWSGTLLSNLTFYLIARCFHRTYATGEACQQRTLTPPDTWSCPTLGLVSILMLIPISPELVFTPDFWVSIIPRYFCFPSIHILIYSLQLKTCIRYMSPLQIVSDYELVHQTQSPFLNLQGSILATVHKIIPNRHTTCINMISPPSFSEGIDYIGAFLKNVVISASSNFQDPVRTLIDGDGCVHVQV